MIKNLIRWARVTKSGSNNDKFPVQQVEYMGKVVDCMIIFPYGMHGNLSVDSLITMFSIQGDAANRAGIGGTPNSHPDVDENGVVFFHPPTGTMINFRDNGDIDIDTKSSNVNVKTKQANVTATESALIDTPETTVTGNMTINGNLQVDGAITADGNITSLVNVIATALLQGASLSIVSGGSGAISGNLTVTGTANLEGKDFLTHTHPQGNDSDGDSQVNTGGVA